MKEFVCPACRPKFFSSVGVLKLQSHFASVLFNVTSLIFYVHKNTLWLSKSYLNVVIGIKTFYRKKNTCVLEWRIVGNAASFLYFSR